MSLERRLRLLDWAHRRDAWIVEDDYDSEFRFASRPLPSLQGLDQHGRVIYIGTFSKVLAPGLRLGFLVVPDVLVDRFVRARTVVDYHPPLSLQAELAMFMAEGHLERHVARLRAVYRERWEVLGAELAALPVESARCVSGAAGLHLTVLLGEGLEDRHVAERALRVGIETPALSSHALERNGKNGLVLGFGASPPEALRSGVAHLRRILASEIAERDRRHRR